MVGSAPRIIRLPAEIRVMIWSHLFGNRLIHMFFDSFKLAWVSLQCKEPESLSELLALVVARNRKPSLMAHTDMPEPFRTRHEDCQAIFEKGHRIGIGAMLACRLFYREIEPILYGRNIFQIETGISFALFIDGRSDRQLSLIRHMCLEIVYFSMNSSSGAEWNTALSPRRLFRLSSTLRRMDVTGIFLGDGSLKMRLLQQIVTWKELGLFEVFIAASYASLPSLGDRIVSATMPDLSILPDGTHAALTFLEIRRSLLESWLLAWKMSDLYPTFRHATGRLLRIMRQVSLPNLPENCENYHKIHMVSRDEFEVCINLAARHVESQARDSNPF